MSKKSSVSLCMITKNEESNIACCINSVRHLIDEIIVVDTGSEDSTITQALQAGAKVFNFNWQYNFAQARNCSLDQATGDWILVLDADEILEYADIGIFNNLLSNTQIEGYFFNVESFIGNGTEKIIDQVVRLFRNRPNYRFFGVIHEQVAACINVSNHGIRLASAGLKILHRGYLNETIQEKNKHFRNVEVINRALADVPNNPFLRYSLGIEYLQQGAVAKGNEQLTKALKHLTGRESYFNDVVMALAAGLLQTGELPDAKKVIKKASLLLPQSYELLLFKGIAALSDSEYETAVQLLQRSIDGIDSNELLGTIHSLCGEIYNTLGDYNKAEKEYLACLQIAPQHLYPLLQIIGIKQQGKSQLSWQEVSKFTSLEISKNVHLSLIKQGEKQLALVVALLSMMNRNRESQALMIMCENYLNAVIHYQPADEFSQLVVEYLKFSGKLIRLYARNGIECALLPVECNIDKIISSNLDLIIETLMPKIRFSYKVEKPNREC